MTPPVVSGNIVYFGIKGNSNGLDETSFGARIYAADITSLRNNAIKSVFDTTWTKLSFYSMSPLCIAHGTVWFGGVLMNSKNAYWGYLYGIDATTGKPKPWGNGIDATPGTTFLSAGGLSYSALYGYTEPVVKGNLVGLLPCVLFYCMRRDMCVRGTM